MTKDSDQSIKSNQEAKKMNEQTNNAGLANVAPLPEPPIPAQPPVTTSPPLPPLPTTGPSSSNNVRATTPGWRFDRCNPGTLAAVSKVVNSRVIDASKIYNGGLSPEFHSVSGVHNNFASNTVQGPASIVELARALKNDPQLIFEYVYNNIEWQPGWGVMKGALGCLMDGSGNSFDQSMLLVALLRQAGFTANYVLGQIRLTEAQYGAWFNTVHAYASYWYAQYANIPGSTPVWNGVTYTMDMSHVWVEVVVSGTTYSLDPSYKQYTRKSPVANLATILGYNQTTFLADATSGATTTTDYVQNMNTKNIAADLTTMTSNLVTYIQNNAVGSAPAGTATMDDVLGGQEIVPITLPFVWSTSLAYEMPGDVPTRWTGDVPLAYKTTLQVQYPLSPSGWAIDQTFTSDQLAGGRLTVTFDGTLHPVLMLNGTVVQTGSQAQAPGSYNSIQLTVNHNAYASPVYPQQWWQSGIYAGQYYLIANAWGNLGRGQADFHQKGILAARAVVGSTNERAIGEQMSHVWFTHVAQASRVADLVGRLNSTYMNFFHQVGVVSYADDGTKAHMGFDIGGVSGFSSTLDYDFTQLSRTNTVVAMHGVALEAASLAQFSGVKPGVSATTVIDKANRTAVVTLGGTVTAGNTLTLTVNDAALSGGTKSKTYTVVGGDTLTTIATALKNAINADTDLSGIGVTATSTGVKILISSTSVNQTSYSSSTSGGATETISIAFSKVYLATPSNWSAGINVSSILTANGYSAGDISGIGSYIATGVDGVLVGDQPGYTLGDWTGEGDWVFPNYAHNGGALGLVAGTYKGGYSQQCLVNNDSNGVRSYSCLLQNGLNGYGIPNPIPGFNESEQPISPEPVGLFSGDYFYHHADMRLGSQTFPYGLAFGRSYNSANRYTDSGLGWGWSHSQDITAKVGSDGLLAMGEQFAQQGGASIVELYVSMDLAADTAQPISKLAVLSLSGKWWIDQLVNNTVIISMPSSTHFYVKQPDGSYTSQGSFPATLTLTAGLFKLLSPQKIEYNFNSDGQIATWHSPSGITVTYGYVGGFLTTISNGLGRTITLNYSGGRLNSVTDGTGRIVSYSYDVNGNLASFTNAENKVTTFSYGGIGQLVSLFLPANPSSPFVTNTYDSLGRVKQQADAYSNLWNYFLSGSRSEETDPLGNSVITYYNRLGSRIKVTNQVGQTWTNAYDGLNRVVGNIAPEGNGAFYEYNRFNLITKTTLTAKPGSGLSDVVTSFTYDSAWNKVKTAVDGNGNTTTFSYDPVTGDLISVQGATVGGITPINYRSYNSRGQILTSTDSLGNVVRFNYDAGTENLLSIINDYGIGRLNLTTSFGYDSVGNSTSITDPNGNTAILSFDGERRLIQSIAPNPFNYLLQIAYDSNGNRIQVRRQTGSVSNPWQAFSISYTIDNKPAGTIDSEGNSNSVQYDGLRRPWKATDARGNVATRTYDAASRLYQVSDQTATICQTQTYSNNGLVSSVIDANSNVTQLTYDGFDRPDKTIYPDSSYEQNVSYDSNFNVLTFRLRSGSTVTFTYDALNRLSSKTPTGQPTTTYSYDIAGKIVSMSVPVIAGDPATGQFQFFYDTAGRFCKEQYPDGKTVEHQLDANGNAVKTTYPDGYYVGYSIDQLNRITDIKLNGSMTSAVAFQYDALSRRSMVTYENGVVTTFSRTNALLTNLTHLFNGSSAIFSYEFDNLGQMISQSVNDSALSWRPSVAATTAYGASNNLNQYPSFAGATLTYNTAGCLIGDGTWTYSYNTQNMLISASKAGMTVDYKYDPRQRQILKTVNGTTKYQFYYSGDRRIADYDGSGNLVDRYIYGSGLDEPLIKISSTGLKTYFHANHQGSIVATSDVAGVVVNKYSYSPFGESTSVTTSMPGYTGQRYEIETGLYYYKMRYYSPALGRFLQPDPVGYASELNLYSYVGNSPLQNTDPLGLITEFRGVPDTVTLTGQIDKSDNSAESEERYTNDAVVWALYLAGSVAIGLENFNVKLKKGPGLRIAGQIAYEYLGTTSWTQSSESAKFNTFVREVAQIIGAPGPKASNRDKRLYGEVMTVAYELAQRTLSFPTLPSFRLTALFPAGPVSASPDIEYFDLGFNHEAFGDAKVTESPNLPTIAATNSLLTQNQQQVYPVVASGIVPVVAGFLGNPALTQLTGAYPMSIFEIAYWWDSDPTGPGGYDRMP
ncbi:MAG: hypothetical protein JSS83_25975 [Cyanobacteria bacterium SZAS LIN-3]|nr:hypothetical protein [Cyanobacteria bacterium SZAS LIN-3]